MKFSDGLFLEVAQSVAKDYPDIEFNDRIVDNLSMQMVSRPEEYDVLVLPNLYGDIISDLCAGLVGGLGLAPGGNIGENGAVFEPVHGSAPRYAGQNRVNPTATILTGALMLRHLGEKETAERVEGAVAEVIREGKDVTYDFKTDRDDPSAVGTQEMADAIIAKMQSGKRSLDSAPNNAHRSATLNGFANDKGKGHHAQESNGVIGGGNVGATAAQRIAERDYADVVLVDVS